MDKDLMEMAPDDQTKIRTKELYLVVERDFSEGNIRMLTTGQFLQACVMQLSFLSGADADEVKARLCNDAKDVTDRIAKDLNEKGMYHMHSSAKEAYIYYLRDPQMKAI